MATYSSVREAIYQAFVAGWGTRTVYHLEGQRFSEPAPDVYWIRLAVRNFAATTETMGDEGQKKHRRTGSVIMSLFAPADQGLKLIDDHAQFALNIFESKNIAIPGGSERVDFIGGGVKEIPLPEGEKSQQYEVEVPFDFTQTK